MDLRSPRKACLTFLAAFFLLPGQTHAQPPGTKLPDVYYMNRTSFKLPVQSSDPFRDTLNEIRIYAKAPNKDWTLQEKGDSSVKEFTCFVPQDGEYWYTLATVDKAGKQNPANPGKEPPTMRVMVDTTLPEITAHKWQGYGTVGVHCTVKDANPDLATLKAVCKTDKGDVELEAMQMDPLVFRLKDPAHAKFPIVISVKDRAGNLGVKEVVVDKLENAPAETVKTLQEKTDQFMEKHFGKDSAEMRKPIRVMLPGIALIAAEKMTILSGKKSIRFGVATIFVPESPTGTKIFHASEVIVTAHQPISSVADLDNRPIAGIEVRTEGTVIAITKLVDPRAKIDVDVRFKFKIDPKTPTHELLPTPIETAAKLPQWTNEDLTKVPELAFGQSISKDWSKHKAMELTAHGMAKINHLNRQKPDGFMLALLERRSDLRGLPFLMGDECRTRQDQAKLFAFIVEGIRSLRQKDLDDEESLMQLAAEVHALTQGNLKNAKNDRIPRASAELWYRTTVAAMTQIFMPESARHRVLLAKSLATIPHIDATRALARLAIFSAEDEVRAAALEGLKPRREKDYTDVLVQGFRYPLPAAAKRSAEALVKLERKDTLENLLQVLEAPDPRLPTTQKLGGESVTVVRELVKVNHHRNCLLCHAPGNTENTPEGVLKVAMPLPGEPLPKPSEGGGYQSTPAPTPDIVVRIDMTYLRQDFSMMMPVRDAHPWPEMQRFDFLVRTRTLTATEARAYEPCCEEEEPGRLSPYHRAALFALRELTGRDTGPTAAAWRKLLKMPKS